MNNTESLILNVRQAGGVSKNITYPSWRHMINRCLNPNSDVFRHYGARGITVCERWKDFALFIKDMGPRPSKKHSINRVNNDGNYEPGNCEWATVMQQMANTRRNVFIKGKHVSAIARDAGVSVGCIQKRIKKGHDLYAPRGTFRRGEYRPTATFTDKEVIKLRRRYRLGQKRGFQTRIAKEYHTTQGTVSEMLNCNTWKHLP